MCLLYSDYNMADWRCAFSMRMLGNNNTGSPNVYTNDFCVVKTQEILKLPNDQGPLFNHVWGKTLRDGSSNTFGLRRHSNPVICPVKALELYVKISSILQINLSNGFRLRPVSPRGTILNKQLSSSATAIQLRLH